MSSQSDIAQQFLNGGVIPADLVGQVSVSKIYVDGQIEIRDVEIASVASVASTAQATIDNHQASAAAHSATSITYSGSVSAATVKGAIDTQNQRIDNIVASGGTSNIEIVDARQPATGSAFPVLRDRLNNVDAQLAEKAEQSALLEAEQRIRDISVNIKNYGAVGGVDSTLAIRDAIDYCYSQGGGDVIIPSSDNGQPFLFSTIAVKENVSLVGAGGILKLMDNVCTDVAVSYNIIHNYNGMGGWFKNVSAINLVVDGNGTNNSLFLVADIITFLGENVKIINCDLNDAPDSGIMFSKVQNGLCINNRINKGRDVGIYVNDGDSGTALHETLISMNRITEFPNGGVALKRVSQRVIVDFNTIYDCGFGITLEQVSGTDYSKNVTIIGNRLRKIGNAGIILRTSNYCIVLGNRIENFGLAGITLEGDSKFCSLSTNVLSSDASVAIVGTIRAGILLQRRDTTYPSFNTITANTVDIQRPSGDNMYAMWLYKIGAGTGGNYNTISGNVLVSASSTGFRIDDTFSNNELSSNTLSGLVYDYHNSSSVKNKYFNNTLVNGTSTGSLGASSETVNLLLGKTRVFSGTAPPTSGDAIAGDIVVNSASSLTKNISEWRCITGNSSGGVWIANGCGQGTTAQRPTLTNNDAGYAYFDTTLAKMIAWSGSAWLV